VTAERDTSLPRWRDPDWRAGATGWVDQVLSARGLRREGDAVEVHARPWSTVWQVPTATGELWFKATARGMAHEAGLVDALARWVPDRVLHPAGVDVARGWLLLPDGGQTLRATQHGHTDLAHWERTLVEYAQLQRALEAHADELLALGVPDARPERLPALREDLLADDAALLVGRPAGMTADQRERQRAASPAYAEMCADLAASGVRPSLQHDDLHDANVFVAAEEVPYRVFDWGDATVAHPFATLLVTLRVVAMRCSLQPDAPELLRLRDAYLEPWTAEHDTADLREAARLAVRTGVVSRAACYRRALLEATPAGVEEYGDGVPGWLEELFEPLPAEPDSPFG
jgi:hypothetical protein